MKCLCESTFIEIQHIELQLDYREELNDYAYLHIYSFACPECGRLERRYNISPQAIETTEPAQAV